MMFYLLILFLTLILCVATFLVCLLRRRHIDRWLIPYIYHVLTRSGPRHGDPIHLILCIADHFEPGRGGASRAQARERVERWVRDYPRLFGEFQDTDGRPPRHTFFYPLEQYDPEHLDALTELCRQGFGEVEVHLHHEGDTPKQLRARLITYKELLARGMVSFPVRSSRGRSSMASFMATGRSITRCSTGGVAESTTSSTFCAKPAAMPISPCHRRQTRPRPGRSTGSILLSMIR